MSFSTDLLEGERSYRDNCSADWKRYLRLEVATVEGGSLCKICGKVLCRPFTLKSHFRNTHAIPALLYACPGPGCGYQSTSKSNFSAHMQKKHPEYRGLNLESCATNLPND